MIINDRIYGDIDINETVIVDLINSSIFQRLKKISQDGATHFIQPNRNVNRYEHSIGVWYLSKLFNRPIEEQIACLLHDLSHTAFSHVIDFVMKNSKHEFADEKLKQIILESEIPEILKNNNISLEKVLNKENYPLLENNLPDVSVDRWDYFMRDGFMMNFLPKSLIDDFLSGIYEKNNIFYFKDIKLASLFAILYMNFCRLIWLDPTSHGSYFLLGEAIKIALSDKLIDELDFFTDDEMLLSKLKNSNNKEILRLLDRLSPNKNFVYADKESAEFFGPNKPRCVDPLVEVDGKLERVSDLVYSLKYAFKEFNGRYKEIGVSQLV
jgi:HD superfamily phosphohydrolase